MRLLFLILIFLPVISLANAFKATELKANKYYYVSLLTYDKKASYIEKCKLVSSKNNVYIIKYIADRVLPFLNVYRYQEVAISQIKGKVI